MNFSPVIRAAVLILILVPVAAHGATITVTATNDAIANDGLCSIQEAIVAANGNSAYFGCPAGTPGLDTIAFAVGGGGAQTISVGFSLPYITEPLNIDGTTQPGFSGTPLILFMGPGGPPFSLSPICFAILDTGGGSTVRSLAFGGFLYAIQVLASSNTIAGNYFGLDQTGLVPIANQVGVIIIGPLASPVTGNTVGGTTAADRNLFAATVSTSLFIAFAGPVNTIRGNWFGFDAAGSVIGTGNPIGMQSAHGTLIANNQMSGSVGAMSLLDSNQNVIQNNALGVVASNGGYNITLQNSNDNVIGALESGGSGGNIITNTTQHGAVHIFSGLRNSILTNSIYGNDGMAIELEPPAGQNANDPCDADTGSNELQNFPTLSRALVSGATTTILGSLDSTASSSFTLEFFSNPASDSEGQTFLGSTIVNTDAGCNAAFTAVLPTAPAVGTYITATATDANNNTSEFSAPVVVVAALEVTKSFSPPSILRNVETSTLTITIRNDNAAAQSNVSFTDVYPAGLVNTALATGDCGGSVISAIGGGSVALNNGTIAGGGTCTVTATVTASNAGAYVNTLPAGSVTSTQTQNTSAATATLNVTELAAPIVTKTFEPAIRRPGEPSMLTITFENASATPISGLAFTDTYPAGLVNVTPLNVSSTCGGTVTAAAGGGSLALSGGTVPSSGTCFVAVMVVVNDYGSYVNTLPVGSITSANAAPNAAPVTAVLSASLPIPTLSTYALAGLAIALAFIAVMKRAV